MKILKDINKRKMLKKAIAGVTTFTIAFQVTATGIFATSEEIKARLNKKELKVAVLSDPHYYPEEYVTDNESQDYLNYMSTELYRLEESAGIFKSALEMVAKDNPDILLIPGDMTKNGEKLAYEQLNEILTEFEDETGIEVFVATGNHDANTGGFKFDENGNKVDLSKEELANIEEYYKFMNDFGYSSQEHNTEFFAASDSREEDAMSYVSRPAEGFVILSLNSNTYKYDEEGNAVEQGTPGFSQELLDWAVEQIKKAEAKGETVIAMSHHALMPHSTLNTLSSSSIVSNWEEVSTTLADAGLRYIFTGHMHENDIAEYTTVKGNTLYDIETGATAGYGSPVRNITFTKGTKLNNGTNQTKETVEVTSKSVKTAQVKGETIDNLQEYLYDAIYKDSVYVEKKLSGALSGIAESLGKLSLEEILFGKDFDTLSKYNLGEEFTKVLFEEFDGESLKTEEGETLRFKFDEKTGLTISSNTRGLEDIITFEGLLKLVRGIAVDFDKTIFNEDFLNKEIQNVIKGILNIEVYNANTPEKKILNDVVNLFFIDHFLGAEDLSGWPKEAIQDLKEGKIVRQLIDDLLSNVLGLLDAGADNIKVDFKNLNAQLGGAINLVFSGSLFKAPTLNQVVKKIGDNKTIADLLMGVLDDALADAITPSFEKQMGVLLADLIYGFAGDDTQDDKIDGKGRTIEYRGATPQVPSVENGLLPNSVAVTFGQDETTQKAFSWYTGKNVTSNVIQYVKVQDAKKDSKGNVIFDNATTVNANSEVVKRAFPTIDLGLIAITEDRDLTRHEIVLSGLEAGTEYYYRLGNVSNGIFAKTATFETAKANDNSFSFVAMGDTQAMLETEYTTWGTVLDKAMNRFEDSKFVVHVGDMVDNGKNELQWQWFFNEASDDLMNTTMITASGNHEEKEDVYMNHFNIDELPEQDTSTGAYYKVDYGNAVVMTLNTNNLKSDKLTTDQIEWLRKTSNESDATWKIINVHKSSYATGTHQEDSDVIAIREQLDSLVTELGIDVVIAGHDHTYSRSKFLINGEIEEINKTELTKDGLTYETAVNPEGTVYMTIGSTGPKFYETQEPSDKLEFAPIVEQQMYTGVTIENNTLYYSAYTVDTETGEEKLLDKYAITKTANKQDLENTIKEAQALVESINPDNYTPESYASLTSALENAKVVFENDNAAQSEVETANSTLKSAIQGLVEVEEEEESNVAFSDIADHWAKGSIEEFASKGYINGYEDNTFRPENSITRAEFVKIINRLYNFEEVEEIGFTDMDSEAWYYDEVCKAVKAGYINGYEDNTFRPDKEITREEASKIIATIENLQGDGVLGFTDADTISDWAQGYVDALNDASIITGYEDNTFRPQNNITRAEAVTMMNRINR